MSGSEIVGLFGCFDPLSPVKGPSFHGVVTMDQRDRYQYIPVKPVAGDQSTHCGLILSVSVALEVLRRPPLDAQLQEFCEFIVGDKLEHPTWNRLQGGAAWVLEVAHLSRYQEHIRNVLRESLLENPMDSVRAWNLQRAAILVEDDALALAALKLQGQDIEDLVDLLWDLSHQDRLRALEEASRELAACT